MNLFLSWTRCSPNHTMVLLLNLNRSCLSLMKADAYTQLLIILKHAQIKVDAMLRFHFFLYLWFTFLTMLPLVVFWFLWWGYVICLALLERFSFALLLLILPSCLSYYWLFLSPPTDDPFAWCYRSILILELAYQFNLLGMNILLLLKLARYLLELKPLLHLKLIHLLLFLLQTPLVAKVELVISPHHFFSIYL